MFPNTVADPASQLLQRYSGRISQIVFSKASLEQLHTEGLISEEIRAKMESCGGLLVVDSLVTVLSAVADDHSKLRLLADVVLKSDESLANELHKECGEWLKTHQSM